ncbi:DUF2249 domain-containing protein [Arthrobacter livingstonensis]|uniref:DUF2249 domain-containing protein n=1 Tax=Arthrobacter livingstonensis TaxID=670078 RepID=UPI001FEC3ED5|nr:DUF2249 domain-containing protein [Arthrobacter livingstonensis]
MNNLVLASSSAEALALEDAKTRLAEAGGTLGTLAKNLVSAAAGAAGELAGEDQAKLVDFAERELLPLAAALARELSGATGQDTLVAQLAAGHQARLAEAVKNLQEQDVPAKIVYAGGRLEEAAVAFLDHATSLIVPALARNPSLTLAGILPERAVAPESAPTPATGGCACGGHDEPGLSELDTRVIPHAIRHATIFGALEGLDAGRGILLVANHNPLPLLAQLEQRSAGKFAVDYVENGPDTWKLSMVRN